jgi:hypothetical protein
MAFLKISTVMPLMVDPGAMAKPKLVPCNSLEAPLADIATVANAPSFAVMLPGLDQQNVVLPLQLPEVPPEPASLGPAVAANASATHAGKSKRISFHFFTSPSEW